MIYCSIAPRIKSMYTIRNAIKQEPIALGGTLFKKKKKNTKEIELVSLMPFGYIKRNPTEGNAQHKKKEYGKKSPG